MKMIFLFLLFIAGSFTSNKGDTKLKKKVLGAYSGTIPGYKMDNGTMILEVLACSIQIELSRENVQIEIGKDKFISVYKVIFEDDDTYVLETKADGQKIAERLKVYKKEKKIIREGIYPQPDAILEKK